jgi:hypothetical protein
MTVIEQVEALLVGGLDPDGESDTGLVEVLSGLQRVVQIAEAETMRHLRVAEARNLPSRLGAAHPTPWAAALLKVPRRTVQRLHRLDRALAIAPVIAGAYATGRITGEQAKLMADTVAVLPAGSEPVVLARGVDLGPDELRVELRDLQEELDPAGTQQRDEDAAARAEERAQARRRLDLSRLDGSNLVHLNGYLDTVTAAPLLTALDALCAPRNDITLGSTGGAADLRTATQRRHDALCEIGNRAQATGKLPNHGGDRPQAVVTVGYQTLVDGLHGLGLLDDGTPLTPTACRLMACDARILPVVMDGESQPLDLGRAQRLFTGALRRALNLRDRGCAFPHCDRGIPWTEAHHCTPWYHGGRTELANGVLVCATHHRLLHHSEWRVEINPVDGLPDFYAPGDDEPQRNHYHRRPQPDPRHRVAVRPTSAPRARTSQTVPQARTFDGRGGVPLAAPVGRKRRRPRTGLPAGR